MTNQSKYQFQGQYLGGLKTYSVHKKSGDTIRTDAPVDNQGTGLHFSPTDLLANALGTCILTVMGIKAASERIKMDGAEFWIRKVMGSQPRRISEIHVIIQMPEYD